MNFTNKCHELVSQIPVGKVSTYKQIATILNTKAYRAVGNAMAKNINLINVPCHRVIRSSGMVGGYALGMNKKIDLLKKEGLIIIEGKVVDYKNMLHFFK